MGKKYLIKMLDGGLLDVYTDSYCDYRGCPTCDYGSRYVSEIELTLDNNMCIKIDLADMYNAPYSEGDLMKLLCSNSENINNMTQEEFAKYLKNEIMKESEKFEYDTDFRCVKNIEI